MQRYLQYTFHFIYYFSITFGSLVLAQTSDGSQISETKISQQVLQPQYVAHPNHRELVLKSFELAVQAGFPDTSGITLVEIRDRLEAGAYSEDFESIPGIIGEHFPTPWDQGPTFDFFGLYPFSKIPYGNYTDTLSGWYRGLNHGYDPVQGFKWPGAAVTTVEWANYLQNSYIWANAKALYNSGNKAEAYECLGHILHLLADLSVPSHIKVVDHGISIIGINSGTIIDPDLMVLIVDEYELALSGGIPLTGIIFIPNLLNQFSSALNLADTANIPDLSNWDNYLEDLGQITYNHPIVNQYYIAPAQDGGWGAALNENGMATQPTQYGITPPIELNGRWVQVAVKSTASSNGSIIPESDLVSMCNYLVPEAVEYGAGLLMHFYKKVTDVNDEQLILEGFQLLQNYPNPFNPITTIKFTLPSAGYATLKIYNALGEEVAVLLDKELSAGTYTVDWNASGIPSGVYFYQLKTERIIKTKKMILMN